MRERALNPSPALGHALTCGTSRSAEDRLIACWSSLTIAMYGRSVASMSGDARSLRQQPGTDADAALDPDHGTEARPPAAGDLRPDRPDAFISYSRCDGDFVVGRLIQSLIAGGRKIWIDVEDIPPATEWKNRIAGGLDAAKAVVCVLSPDFARSQQCRHEVERAVEGHKLLVPVLFRAVEPDDLPEALRQLNWVALRESDNYEVQIERLQDALTDDIGWRDMHARLTVRAREWQARSRDASYLLRGHDLADAEEWLRDDRHHRIGPTPLQTSYLVRSRQASTRRQRVLLGAVVVALAVTTLLAVAALVSRNQAVHRQHIADSRRLATASTVQARPDLALGLLLAASAERVADTDEARASLLSALRAAPALQRLLAPLPGEDIGRLRPWMQFAYAPDGSAVAAGTRFGSVAVWPLRGRGRPTLIKVPTDFPVHGVAFRPDGRLLAADTNGRAWTWDIGARDVAKTRQQILGDAELAGTGSGPSTFAAIDPAGRYEAVFNDVRATVWRVDGQRASLRGTVELDAGGESGASFGDDGRMLVLAGRRGARVIRFSGNRARVEQLNVRSPWPAVTAAAPRGGAIAMQVASGLQVVTPTKSYLLPGEPNDAVFTPDGTRIAVGGADGLTLRDTASGAILASLLPADRRIVSMAFSPDGRSLAAGGPGLFPALLDPTGATRALPRADVRGDAAAVAPDDRGSAMATGTRIALSGRGVGRVQYLMSPVGTVKSLSFSPDGADVVAQGSAGAAVWSVADSARSPPGLARGAVAFAVAASRQRSAWIDPHGRLVLADGNRRPSGPPLPLCRSACFGDPLLALSADGRRAVAGASNDSLVLVDVSARRAVARLESRGGHASIEAVAVSPDGRRVAEGLFKSGFLVRDTGAPRRARPLNLPGSDPEDATTSSATSLAFSPDGRLLATGDGSGRVMLWSIATLSPVGPQLDDAATQGFQGVKGLTFDANGGHLAAWAPPQLMIWDLRPHDWTARACARAGRVLTQQEWRRFLPDEPYRPDCPP